MPRCKYIECKKKFESKYFNQKYCNYDCQKNQELLDKDKPEKITGTSLTKKLIKDLHQRGNKMQVANIYFFKWESDVFNISRSDLITEYEIKISRADYAADFKKKEKHQLIESSYNKTEGLNVPNKFFYVVPEGLIKEEEVPAYAGLMVLTKYGGFKQLKKAPFLHKEKVSPSIWEQIAMKFYYKTL